MITWKLPTDKDYFHEMNHWHRIEDEKEQTVVIVVITTGKHDYV